MRFRGSYPLVTTPRLFDARDFYLRHFDFEIVFQSSWFVLIAGAAEGEGGGAALGFMSPDHPSAPPGPETFDGVGIIWTLEVADAKAVHARVAGGGAPIVHPLTDEPWGQRRFMSRDPSGLLVDVVESIEPAPGFWDRYVLDLPERSGVRDEHAN